MNAPLILTISCLLGALFLPAKVNAGEWEKLPSLPEPNGGFACGVCQGQIVVAGGTNWAGGEKHWLSDVHMFDPQTRTWSRSFTLDSPMAYGVSGLVKKGTALWDRMLLPKGGAPVPPAQADGDIFGFVAGTTGKEGFSSAMWIIGPRRHANTAGLPVKETTVLAAGGVIDDQFILVGGTDDPANLAGFRRKAFLLDAEGKASPLPDHPGRAFGTAASCVLGRELYIFGGAAWKGVGQEVENLDQACAYSTTQQAWKKLASLPVAIRGITAVALDESRIYLAGGYKNDADGFTNEAFLYDAKKDVYRPARSLPYKGMVSLAAADGFVYCLGGEDAKKSRTDACFRIPLADLLK